MWNHVEALVEASWTTLFVDFERLLTQATKTTSLERLRALQRKVSPARFDRTGWLATFGSIWYVVCVV